MTQKQAQVQGQPPGHTNPNDLQTVREIDPNVLQRRASDPNSSIWVTASAGTGKTKVLTDRVLRLLLPRPDGQPGTAPQRILCITFTKAGAGEMTLRLTLTLAEWAVMETDNPDEKKSLRARLQKLLLREPGKEDIAAARRLFASVADTPGGLKIMTIHAFCQSVLGRFPLEAGIPPHFSLLESNDAEQYLEQAQNTVLKTAETGQDPALTAALERTARTINQEQFLGLLTTLVREREQLARILKENNGINGIYQSLCTRLALPPGKESSDIINEACQSAAFDEPALRRTIKPLAESKSKSEPDAAIEMQLWLDAPPESRAQNFPTWKSIFLTQDNTPRKNFPTKAVAQKSPECQETLHNEAERLLQITDRANAAACALQTRDLLILGNEILNQYQELKREQAVLDYDDLIFTTLALLEGRTGSFGKNAAAWVLYKLDHGLEHILVDEAQDTNPEQWKIIKALCEEFTDGQGAADIDRSIFVVGDEKQSIYSFQRASPQEFSNMQQFLRSKTKAAGKNWDDVPMNISFRSAKSVLQIVDAVFTGAMQYGVSKTPVTHTSFRIGQAGRIELWPLCTTDAKETFNPWTPPVQIVESTSGSTRLAAKIAETIEHWIKSGEKLPSKNEGIKPGDIMILLRTRSAFFTQIAKALKDRKIPVSGTDRMILNTQIAVQDLLAFAQFALQPLDDLNLACLLKSPLIGMDEDSLFALAHNRKGTLWDELLQRGSQETKNYLNRILQNAPGQRPFDFFSDLLQSPCPADNQSGGRAIQKRLGHDSTDPIDELLNAALNYESGHIPSLQHFLQWQTASETEIKREMEEKGGFVRIMTIHGAKGLQAPIVILPDTIRSNSGCAAKADDRLLWPDKTGFPLPLWSPRKDDMFTEYSNARAVIQQRTDEEYRRLLYVAMTRAEDRLYLCGYTGQKPAKIESWYDALKTGMTNLETVIELEDGSLRLDNPQTRDPETKDKTAPKTAAAQKIPEYLYKPADHEAAPAAPLSPSRGAGDETEPAALSPSRPDSPHRFRRGNLTHKLLEVLPALPQQKREAAAEKFLARFAPDLDEDTRRSIIKETITILDHPDYAPIFGPGSLAEIAIAGTMKNGQAISGKIDRLLITPTHIYIIDYKTNRPPPQDPASIPALYRNQMAAYADILSQIYPKREVKCALLWTDGPRLMPLKA